MKYCMRYDNRSRHINDFDEVILNYTHKTSEIIDHVAKYKQEQRIILNVAEMDNEELLKCKDIFAAAGEVANIAIMGDYAQRAALKELGLPFFFQGVIDSWDELNASISLGASDVFVGNEFAFNMRTISEICKRNGVKVRAYANVAQSSSPALEGTITHFYIRPEDIKFYEEFVDVIEFYGPLNRQDVLYDIYTNGKWIGYLNNLILGFDTEINNTVITGHFGALRTNCGKRCSYSDSCNVCTRFVSVNNTLQEAYNEHEADEVSV